MLRCDMCHKPLKGARFKIETLLRPEHPWIVGPDCYRKEQKARKQMLARYTPEQIESLRDKVAAQREQNCPGHIASDQNPKICARCGVHVNNLA